MHLLNNQALIVLGMHRSGTSVLAGALRLLGVELSRHLMAPQPDNASGFWEHDGIVKLHDELLAKLGSAWDDICPLPHEWWLATDAKLIRRQLASVLIRDFSNAPLWALKDPRMCRLLPLWIPLFQELKCRTTYLLTSRNPWEIARSIVERDDFSIEKSLLLCLENLHAADTDSRGQSRTVIRFDDIVNDPARTMSELGERLGIRWPNGAEGMTRVVEDFVKYPAKPATEPILAEPAARWIEEIHCAFDAGAAGDEAEMQRRLDRVWTEWAPGRQLYVPAIRSHELLPEIERLRTVAAAQTELSRQFLKRLYSAEREAREKKVESRKRKAKIDEIENSAIWKATGPLRNITRSFWKRVARAREPDVVPDAGRAVQAGSAPKFAPQETPAVSIIIPVFNKPELTRACLHAIARHTTSGVPFEVIIVDDGSSAATRELARRHKGARYFRNEKNSGFVVSCNRGAEEARGKFLLFLNNDTTVTRDWLEPLLRVFESRASAGIVGSKLIYPTGKLQEAGGIIFNDGSAMNAGNGKDSNAPEYNFVREVDFCSAACLMIPQELFREMGGFDIHFAPGYYEDVDLAFRVQSRGLEVFYQPASVVIHHEGGTAGKDLNTGMKQHQATNRIKFFDRWTERLATHPKRSAGEKLRRLQPGAKNILVIDDQMPMHDQHAGGLRMFEMLRIFRELGHAVTFMPASLAPVPGYTERLQQEGIHAIYKPWCELADDFLQAHAPEFDVIILSRLLNARKYLHGIRKRAPKVRIIFDTVDLHFLRESREAALHQDSHLAAAAAETKSEELLLARDADEIWVVSTVEKAILEQERVRRPVAIVPTIQAIHGRTRDFAGRRDLLFIGGFKHRPNLDAVQYFAGEIFPLVQAALPGVKFIVVGANPPPEIEKLATEQIMISGFVPDLEPMLESVRLTVAPLRFGAGVKGKINLSLAHGVPAVATEEAIEGMGLVAGEDILTGDSSEEFAAAVIRLYRDEMLWNRLSDAGLKKTQALYSIKAAKHILAMRI